MEKRIEEVHMKVRDIKTGFGNPRKITKAKRDELKESMMTFGDFGIFIIDEHDNIIAGNQRLSVLQEIDEKTEVLCKRLIGYSEAELRAINIKDNTHSGEWDLDMLADWTADLSIDLGLNEDAEKLEKKKIEAMEPIRFEKYDYVMIVCDNEIDYNELIRNLGLEKEKVRIAKRKINARAVWYHEMKVQIVPKDQVEEINKESDNKEATENEDIGEPSA